MNKNFEKKLQDLKKENLFRQRVLKESGSSSEIIIDGKKYLSFASNDYLGMSNNYELQEALSESCKKNGLGSGSSPLISGYSESHKELECLISEFLGTQSTIIFSSGYQTNVGVIKSISESTDHILIDKLDHASIVDGTLFSKAKFKRYSHNNISDLNEKVNESDKDIIVCVDSLFSMDGDFAKLNEIQKIKKDKDFYLLVDEAHALGVYGSGGRGLCNEMNIPMNEMVGITGTFGKSFGTFGAFFSGSHDVVNFVLQNSRSYIYSTSLPRPIIDATIKSINIVMKENWRREKLFELIEYFKKLVKQHGLNNLNSHSHVQPLVIGDERKCINLSESLYNDGIFIPAIRYPTVEKGQSRLRISLSSEHEKHHIDHLFKNLKF